MSLMDDTVEMVRSNKGGAKIIHRGYMYTVHKKKIGGIRWRCARRILHCKGSITTGKTGPPIINLPHNHVPDLHAVAIARCRSFGEDPPDHILDFPVPQNFETPSVQDTKNFNTRIPGFELQNFELGQELFPQIKQEKDFIEEKTIPPTTPSPNPPPLRSILKPVPQPGPTTIKPITPQITKPATRNSKPNPSAGEVIKETNKNESKKDNAEEAESEVCLRWNSHHSNMQNCFPHLMDKEQYVDVTLAAGGQLLKCHKLILSSCSSYFDEMFKSVHPFQHPIIFLQNMEFWQVKSLVEFMYRGEVNVDQTKLESLLHAAETLQIKGLAGKTSVKKEPEEKDSSVLDTMDESMDELIPRPESPAYVMNPGDEDEFKPYYYYKKKLKKTKKRKIPTPGQIKTVPCNLKGTKSRPNIKQPVFYDPDFPDHDPTRSVSPPSREIDPVFQIDNIKLEPLDLDNPASPHYESSDHEIDKPFNNEKLPLIVEIRSGLEVDQEEPVTKKKIIDESPIIIERVSGEAKENPNVEITLEKLPETNTESDLKKKFCIRVVKMCHLNGSDTKVQEENKTEGDI